MLTGSKVRIIIISVICLNINLFGQGHSNLVKIKLKGKSFEDLRKTGLAFDHGYYKEGESFTGDFSKDEISKLVQLGFEMEQTTSASLAPRTRPLDCNPNKGLSPDYEVPANYSYGTMNGFLNLQELYDNLDLMHELYPNLISKRTKIGNFVTEEGRSIYYLIISDGNNVADAEPQVLYTALHHAREPASMSQMLFYMWYLLENYERDPMIKKLVDSRQLYFIPCVNPDGYYYNQKTNPSGFGYWRKNRVKNDQTYGVDLNRNYGYEWGFNDVGSSSNEDSETFRGASAFSETETQAVKKLCNDHDFKIAINYHSYGNILIIPWGYSNTFTKDNEQYLTLAEEFTKYNNFNVGTAFNTLNYEVNGVSDDWMYGDNSAKEKILAFTPEVGTEFWPARQDIAIINQSTQQINFSAAWNAGSVATMKEESPYALEPNSGKLTLIVKRTGLENSAIKIKCFSDVPNSIHINNPDSFYLSSTQEKIVDINYDLISALQRKQIIHFNIVLETGDYSETINVDKTFLGTPYWKDEANSTDYWSTPNNNLLELTNEDFVSTPSCFTDSPNAKRFNNQTYIMDLKNFIDLSSATYAYLTYKMKYDLNPDEDFAQVMISQDGERYIPLCSKSSVVGNFLQGIDQPVYSGLNKSWVCEWIDLKDYVGKQIKLQLKIGTGSTGNHDGFYIDDIKVYADLISSTSNTNSSISIYPQPAKDEVYIYANSFQIKQMNIINGLGLNEKINFNKLGDHYSIDVARFPKGIYFLQLMNDKNEAKLIKLLLE